ncbi:hypothetical protein OAK75_02895 [Bacteriovoracales bacterium]|nr:hypothetical protein [Bacteriovoracales bacterium]
MKLMIVILLALFQTNLAQSELLKDPYLFYKSKKEYLCGQNMLAPYFGLKMPLKIEKLIINRNLDKALIEAQYGKEDLTCQYRVFISLNEDHQFKSIHSTIKNMTERENCKEGKQWLDIIFEYGNYNYIRGNTLISLTPNNQMTFCHHEVKGLDFQLYGIQL